MSLKQGFPKGGNFSDFWVGVKVSKGRKGGNFKICRNELILKILKLHMKSEKKGLRRIYISNFETFTRYSKVKDEIKGLRGRLLF